MSEKRKTNNTILLLLPIVLLASVFSSCGEQDAPEEIEISLAAELETDEEEEEEEGTLTAALEKSLLSHAICLGVEEGVVFPEPDPSLFSAYLAIPTALYSTPSSTEPLCQLASGVSLTLRETNDPLWYAAILDDGTEGYVYGECLFPLTETQEEAVNTCSLSMEGLRQRLDVLQACFPQGKYWNHAGIEVPAGTETPWSVTDIPCNHSVNWQEYCNFYNGTTLEVLPFDSLCQCSAFASFLSDQLFGEEAGLHVFNDPDLLRVGDHIRLREYEHSMVVIGISDGGYTVAEVNQDYEHCMISWSRTLSRQELVGLLWDSEYISRYPLCPDGAGGYTQWPEAG